VFHIYECHNGIFRICIFDCSTHPGNAYYFSRGNLFITFQIMLQTEKPTSKTNAKVQRIDYRCSNCVL